jgi:ATP-binding cassette subfamily B protein
MSDIVEQNSLGRNSDNRNAVREVLVFLFRHWQREAWCATGVAAGMAVATAADLLLPVYSGHLVDAVAR